MINFSTQEEIFYIYQKSAYPLTIQKIFQSLYLFIILQNKFLYQINKKK